MAQDRIVGYIPKVVLVEFGRQDNYALFLTKKRLVFLLSGRAHIATGAVLGGAFGAFIAREVARDNFDFSNFDLESKLAVNKLNIEIPIDRINEVKMKRELGGYYPIRIFGLNKKNKKAKLFNGYFIPPKDMNRYYMQMGYNEKDIRTMYARNNQDALVSVLGDKVTVRYFQ